MTELNRLFEAIQSIRRLCPEVPLLAIPWMHLKHPIHPVQQELLGSASSRNGRTPRVWLTCAVRAFFSLGYAFYFTLRLLQVRVRHAAELRTLRKQSFDLVAKTWRFQSTEGFGTAEKAGREDFYYGNLGQGLKKRGVRMLLLYNYPQGAAWKEPRAAGEDSELQELSLLSLADPVRHVFRQWRTSARLRGIARKTHGLEARVAEQAMQDCLSHRYFLAGLSDAIFRRAAEIWNPKALLTLYEGHAWEQLAWAAVKEVHPSCKTVGYQHTALFPHQLSLLRSVDGGSAGAKPDVVLCLGPATLKMLQTGHPTSRLIPFGTFRRTARMPEPASPAPQRKTVLVLPEAHAEEMRLLFRTAVRAAELLPDHRFILRCHPMLPSPIRQVLSYVDRDLRTLPNVEISSGKGVEADFARSSVLLYRGSSSVLYAVRLGLKPINLRDGALPNLDSLFDLHTWKEEVRTAEQMADCLRRYAAADSTLLQQEWKIASEFVRSYAIPVEDPSVDRLVEVLS